MSVVIRPWTQDDAAFVIKVRNHPDLQKWFKQDADLTLEQQQAFMYSCAPNYHGFIIECDNTPVGIVSLRFDKRDRDGYPLEADFGIAILPEFQGRGVASVAMRLICDVGFDQFHLRRIHSDVFVTNPALPFYFWKCGFTANGVRERAYWKKDIGMVDVVMIEKLRGNNAR